MIIRIVNQLAWRGHDFEGEHKTDFVVRLLAPNKLD